MAENNEPSAPKLYPDINSPIANANYGLGNPGSHIGFAPHAYPNQPPINPAHPPSHPYANPAGLSYPPQPSTCWFPTCPPPNIPPNSAPVPQPVPQWQSGVHKASNSIIAYQWVSTTSYSGVPPLAVRGGTDQDGSAIYVGRAFHDGDNVPAKVIPSKSVAYIAYGGEEIIKHEYEVLCEQKFEWMPNVGGNIPPSAVAGGRTSSGETLYIGRVKHEGSHTVGKVHPSHGSCYIPFNGEEVAYPEYEILCLSSS